MKPFLPVLTSEQEPVQKKPNTDHSSERLPFVLEAECKETLARAATFHTLHGPVQTPVFMPVGTQAAIKGQDLRNVEAMGFPVILANTYHLLLRPGPEIFEHFGGIHGFNRWPRSVLTDSGGFQIFSLPGWRKIEEQGALFRSHHDDLEVVLTPERSIAMQRAIGSDIMMVLDVCVPATAPYALAKEAMERTHRWALRSLEARGPSPQALFGIVQGACHRELRQESAAFLSSQPFEGFAIGGLAVGETRAEREEFTDFCTRLLPKDRPRYLMGVGTPLDLLEAVARGVDLFDCILPTALAQQGIAFTTRGKVELRRGVYSKSNESLDPDCECSTCKRYSRGYLFHLIRVKEIYGWQLVGEHNLWFYRKLMLGMRQAILEQRFGRFYAEWKPILEERDLENPVTQPKRKRPANAKRRGHEIPLGGTGKRLGNYQIQRSQSGHFSIQHCESLETMHALSEPMVEANRLYVEQPKLVELTLDLARRERSHVVWDVGLGAATNAMAAISAVEKAILDGGLSQESNGEIPARWLDLVSFEVDLDPLRLALSYSHGFQYLWHPAPSSLLSTGEWVSSDGRIRWRLVSGDFAQTFKSGDLPLPGLVYYDPFSAKTDRGLWSEKMFEDLFDRFGSHAVELITYSASNAVRAKMLAAGFWVGRGLPTPPKEETTRFFTPAEAQARLAANKSGGPKAGVQWLDTGWLASWSRSGARSELTPDALAKVDAHLQFRSDLG